MGTGDHRGFLWGFQRVPQQNGGKRLTGGACVNHVEKLPKLQQCDPAVMTQPYLCWPWCLQQQSCRWFPVFGPVPAEASESWYPEDWDRPPPAHSPPGSGLTQTGREEKTASQCLNPTITTVNYYSQGNWV